MNRDRKSSKARLQAAFVLATIAGGAVLALGWVLRWFYLEEFFRGYLVAWLYWLAISLGSLMLLLLHNLTGGAWGWVSRHVLVAAASTLPLVGLLFLPIAFGLSDIYQWANQAHMASDPILAHKARYLNPWWFFLRMGSYWLIWLTMLFFVRVTSRRVYAAETAAARRTRVVSGIGLALSGLAVTFASFDLGMSLEPKWYSTIYGVIFFVGQGLAALAFVIVALDWWPPVENSLVSAGPDDLHDLGKLLLAFTMFWAYVSFSQFLIIWYGNLPEEIVWYERRLAHGWQWVAIAIAVFHFMLPFVVLLGRGIKRQARPLAAVALWILVMRWLDTVWQIEPAFAREDVFVPWLDLAITAAIGGVWLVYFTWLVAPVAAPGRGLASQQEDLVYE
jgi:hypothetical protein